jgi:ABC-type Fe3+/spermidine/putrescine transport system ATPase subunit
VTKPVLELSLRKAYPEFAIDLELEIENGEFFSLLGPSGCGKTTLLRLIAGLDSPDEGKVLLNGRDITNLSPDKRRISLVFQNYALFPHLNVTENIEYGLKLGKHSSKERKQRVAEMLGLFRIETLAKRMVSQLSGGEQQRVALARALAPRPEILLLDEPFSALDYEIRSRLREELKQLQQDLGFTTIFVTHQQEEAVSISDRIGLMRQGRIIQVGKPTDVYRNPVNSFVATFLGDANLIPCRFVEAKTGEGLVFPEIDAKSAVNAERDDEGDRWWLMVRPEDIRLQAEKPQFEGEIIRVEYLGPFYRLEVDTGRFQVKILTGKEAGVFKRGMRVGFGFDPEAVKALQNK